MTQIAQPQLHVSILRSHRALVLAGLAAIVAAATAVALIIALDSGQKAASSPPAHGSAAAFDAGPTADTPSAVAQTFGAAHVRAGLSLTTNVPALPQVDAGPSSGTMAAVAAALRPAAVNSRDPSSLTTNVPALPRAEAGPATGTPTAVRDALSGR
jgi:hypothetical protein